MLLLPLRRLGVLVLPCLLVGATLEGQPRASLPGGAAPKDARDLFVANCAPCHGEKGDGKGTTQLDRPARSFLDGGFSYGNTRSAIFRSLTYGIPGTPMPSFDVALSEEQRLAVADYVISLTPERREVTTAESVLEVTDRPLIVRGYLPPIVDGAPERVRGLLVGLPTGTTFEYDASDVRLVGVRQGGFVERRDWGGRGGDPLLPLGMVTILNFEGRPGPTFARVEPDGSRTKLRAKLMSTLTLDGEAVLTYELLDEAGLKVAVVRERPRVIRTSVGAGIGRSFVFEAPRAVELEPRAFSRPGYPMAAGGEGNSGNWWVDYEQHKLPDGTYYVLVSHLVYPESGSVLVDPGGSLRLRPGEPGTLDAFAFVLEDWSREIKMALVEETF